MDEKRLTAIHEAGHAVANNRNGFTSSIVTIVPGEGYNGRQTREDGDVYDHEDASKDCIAFAAGYAALAVSGVPKDEAVKGCGSDFDHIEEHVSFWFPDSTLEQWKQKAVELLDTPENRRAIEMVAGELLRWETLYGDHADVVVEWADGEITEADYQRYLTINPMTRQPPDDNQQANHSERD